MEDARVRSALAHLQKRGVADSTSLFEHLTDIAIHLKNNQSESVDVSYLSTLLKRQAQPLRQTDPTLPCTNNADDAAARNMLHMFGDRERPIDPATGLPVHHHEPNTYACENMMESASMFDALGVGLDAQEVYQIMLQLKRLGSDPKFKLRSVRFFGKFFGMFKDYFVFEGVPREAPPAPAETAEEKSAREAAKQYPVEQNSGANEHLFFVCNQLGAKAMTQLPPVRPEHIVGARDLCRLMTGHLDAPVSTYPPYPWPEAVFLRAQIARIAANTVLAPAGWFSQEENDDGQSVVVPAEEIEAMALPDGDPQEWLANWVHRNPHMKRQGRCETKPVRELPEDAEEEVELTPDEQEEPPEGGQVLGPIAEDSKVYGAAAWTPMFSSASKFSKGQVLGVRSNLWPGAVSVTHGLHSSNIYVGWGLKNAPYVPLPPPPIAQEFDQGQMASTDLSVKPDPDAVPPPDEGNAEQEE